MKFSLFKEDKEKIKKRDRQKRTLKTVWPVMRSFLKDYRRLPRNEKKIFREESKKLNDYIKLALPDYNEKIDLLSLSKDSPEIEKFKEMQEKRQRLASDYLSAHIEIPERVKDLLLKANLLVGVEFYDKIISGD